jgi:phosphohistidine swiveling domain-containing protein
VSEFVVEWKDPADAERSWRLDRLHFPDPIAPLDFWLFRDVVRRGIMSAARLYGTVQDYRTRRINTYLYVSAIPAPAPEGAEVDLDEATLRVRELWEDEILPQVRDHLAWWASFDLASMSMEKLVDHLQESVARAGRVWHLHFCLQPAFTAVVELTELFLEVSGGSDLDAFKLVQGFGNKTVEAGRELWKLGRKARAAPEVAAALANPSTPLIIIALEANDAGRTWLADLGAFLDAYGQRSNRFGISDPSWIEDPSAAIDAIRRFMSQPVDPQANLERLAAERDAAVAAARERFAAASDEHRERFEVLLPAAQAGNVITEDHGFYIDFATNYQLQRVFIEVGRRLASAGVIDDRNDVAMLELDEILDGARELGRIDRRELVRARREEMERCGALHPPEFVGAKQVEMPADDPRGRFIRRFFGPASAGVVEGELRGAAGAPGRARGVARLVLDLNEASKLEPGDVLVTKTTTPAWTPLFAVATAVVTDGGGALSHCAIVAREYGVPAVVGTIVGTQTIVDGQTIEVDGDEGIVRVISSTA